MRHGLQMQAVLVYYTLPLHRCPWLFCCFHVRRDIGQSWDRRRHRSDLPIIEGAIDSAIELGKTEDA